MRFRVTSVWEEKGRPGKTSLGRSGSPTSQLKGTGHSRRPLHAPQLFSSRAKQLLSILCRTRLRQGDLRCADGASQRCLLLSHLEKDSRLLSCPGLPARGNALKQLDKLFWSSYFGKFSCVKKVNESRSGWTMITILELQYFTPALVISYHTQT